MMHRYFTRDEAKAKIGKKIRTNVDFSGVPAGTSGTVDKADFYTSPDDNFTLAIVWDLPGRLKPLVDWFDKDDYERFLEEI